MQPPLRNQKNGSRHGANLLIDDCFFMDEARFGTDSKTGYGWFPKGLIPNFANNSPFSSVAFGPFSSFEKLLHSNAMRGFSNGKTSSNLTFQMANYFWHLV